MNYQSQHAEGPLVEICHQRLLVRFGGATIAATTRGFRVTDESSSNFYYFPPEHVNRALLSPMQYRPQPDSIGTATYWVLSIRGLVSEAAAWSYEFPNPSYLAIRSHYSFHVSRVDQCFIGPDLITPIIDLDSGIPSQSAKP